MSSLGNDRIGREGRVGFVLRYRLGFSGVAFWASQCTALRGIDTVVNFDCLGSASYSASISMLSPIFSMFMGSSVFRGVG